MPTSLEPEVSAVHAETQRLDAQRAAQQETISGLLEAAGRTLQRLEVQELASAALTAQVQKLSTDIATHKKRSEAAVAQAAAANKVAAASKREAAASAASVGLAEVAEARAALAQLRAQLTTNDSTLRRMREREAARNATLEVEQAASAARRAARAAERIAERERRCASSVELEAFDMVRQGLPPSYVAGRSDDDAHRRITRQHSEVYEVLQSVASSELEIASSGEQQRRGDKDGGEEGAGGVGGGGRGGRGGGAATLGVPRLGEPSAPGEPPADSGLGCSEPSRVVAIDALLHAASAEDVEAEEGGGGGALMRAVLAALPPHAAAHLASVRRSLPPAAIRKAIQALDKDGDGFIVSDDE